MPILVCWWCREMYWLTLKIKITILYPRSSKPFGGILRTAKTAGTWDILLIPSNDTSILVSAFYCFLHLYGLWHIAVPDHQDKTDFQRQTCYPHSYYRLAAELHTGGGRL